MVFHARHALATTALIALSGCAADEADLVPGAEPDAGAPDQAGTIDGGAVATCPAIDPPVEIGHVQADVLEVSGLVVSRVDPSVLWLHEDGDGAPELIAIALDGEVLATLLLDHTGIDPEDLALGGGPDDDRTYLYLADTGDNSLERAGTVQLLRVAEPTILGGGAALALSARPDVIELAYEDGAPHDAEAVVIDPVTGDLYLFTKRNERDPITRVYRAARVTHAAHGARLPLTLVLTEDEQPALAARLVSADRSPDGRWLLIGAKDASYRLWPLGELSIAEAVRAKPCRAPVADGQVETGAFGADGNYYLVPEGARPPVLRAALRE